jgi:hypothetical protein
MVALQVPTRQTHRNVQLMLHGIKHDGEITSKYETRQGDQEQPKDQKRHGEQATEYGSRNNFAIAHGRDG